MQMLKTKKINNVMRKRLSVMSVILVMMYALSAYTLNYSEIKVYAAGTDYETWEDYKAGTGIKGSTWNEVCDAIDEVLDKAASVYKDGDAEGALSWMSNAKNSYWGASGFKIEMQKKLPSANKKNVETNFSTCNSVIKNNGSQDELDAGIEELKSSMRTAANKLDGVEEEIEIAEETDTAATDIFAIILFAYI